MYGCASSSCFGLAEHALPRRIHALEIAVEAGDAEHVERHVKKRSSSSCARRRSMNMPISLPTVVSIESSSSSGSRISGLKNSSTLCTSPRRQDRKAKRRVQPLAGGDDARAGSSTSRVTSGIQAGWPLAQTRPGKPTPFANVDSAADGVELGQIAPRQVPDVRAAEHAGFAIDGPQRAVHPAERFADRFAGFAAPLRRSSSRRESARAATCSAVIRRSRPSGPVRTPTVILGGGAGLQTGARLTPGLKTGGSIIQNAASRIARTASTVTGRGLGYVLVTAMAAARSRSARSRPRSRSE